MYRYLLTVSYDGSNFFGWAKQNNKPTIQGEIESALSKIFKSNDFHTLGASKTDARVHALDQKVFLQTPFSFNFKLIEKTINKTLDPAIYVKSIIEVDKDFLVRNCKEKIYNYNISKREYNVFKQRYYYYPSYHLDSRMLKESLKLFVGNHDFLNFSGIKSFEKETINTKREINSINVIESDDEIIVEFKAKGFIRYQIRTILGACFAYCKNEISLDKIKNVLELKEDKMLYIAKPNGLVLTKISY